jgi:hypothetical protein
MLSDDVWLGSSDLMDETDGRSLRYLFIVAFNAVFIVSWFDSEDVQLSRYFPALVNCFPERCGPPT